MTKPAVSVTLCAVLICSLNSLAAERQKTSFASLPAEAQAGIKAAMHGNVAIQNFTLTASGGVNEDGFGTSVAIEGNTIVVGAIDATFNNGNPGPGAAYVFVKPPSGWGNMTQTAKLTASDGQNGDAFGVSVSINANTVAVGAQEARVNGNLQQGAAYLFVEPQGGWTDMTETAKLTASDGTTNSFFGTAVSISANTVVVGSPFGTIQSPLSGSSYVFVEPVGGWSNMTQTAELTPSNGTLYDYFGYAVSVNSGNVVIGGGLCGGACAGSVYVFSEPPNGWVGMTETARLTNSDGGGEDMFGNSVLINGKLVVVGAPGHGFENGGASYVFLEPPSGWVTMTQTAELTVQNAKLICLGNSVSMSGNVILAGANCTHGDTGAAYVFVEPSGGWRNSSTPTLRVSIPFQYQSDNFGGSVAISGTTGVVGASGAPTSLPCRNGNCTPGPGEAFIFTAQ